MAIPVLEIAVQAEHDLVLVRQRTRQLAERLGLDPAQQTRLATAVSEISRNAFQYAGSGDVELFVTPRPPRLSIRVRDTGPGIDGLDDIVAGRYRSSTGLGLGLAGAKRLVDHFEIRTSPDGTVVTLGNDLPADRIDEAEIQDHAAALTRTSPGNPFGEVLQQNQDMFRARNALEAANRELEESQAAKDRFLAMLAHELRNVLNALRSALQVLKTRPDETVRGRMEAVADQQVEHLQRLIDDMLDVSRMVRGVLELQRRPVELGHELGLLAEAWRRQAAEAGLHLELRRPEGAVWTSVDPTRLTQILTNLISNACKFTDPGGHIHVEIQAGDPVRIAVEDDGCGLDDEGLSTMFTAFAQTAEARRRMTGGLGLGLAVVKGLVEAHGGTVTAHSDGPGRGLAVTFTLPSCAPPAVERPVHPGAGSTGEPDTEAGADAGRRILLVDDHEASILGLSELLRLEGHRVDTAADGPSALAVFRDAVQDGRPFDVVICDLGLPGMDGFEVARRLVAAQAVGPLIAVSGFVDDDTRERALASGFSCLLPKPVDLNRLLELLGSAGSRSLDDRI